MDASDLPAYANGQRYVSKHGPERERFSDPDASGGAARRSAPARAAGSTGTRCTRPVCARTDLPIARSVRAARTHESSVVSIGLTGTAMAVPAGGDLPSRAIREATC